MALEGPAHLAAADKKSKTAEVVHSSSQQEGHSRSRGLLLGIRWWGRKSSLGEAAHSQQACHIQGWGRGRGHPGRGGRR